MEARGRFLGRSRLATGLWLGLAVGFAIACGWASVTAALAGTYVVQDDARQHLFWMRRYLDPGLFPGDLLADYFQSVAPWGYQLLYWLPAQVGIDPLVVGAWMPALLGLITTVLAFRVAIAIAPVPWLGFLAATQLNISLWIRDDLASATPRAFVFPLFLAFLDGVLRSSWPLTLGAIALLGLFYPQYVLVAVATLTVRAAMLAYGRYRGDGRGDRAPENLKSLRLALAGVGLGVMTLCLYKSQSSAYGPVISVEQARSLPEFVSGGRAVFFRDDWAAYWLMSHRSSLLPKAIFTPVTLIAAVVLPAIAATRRRWSILATAGPGLALLGQWILGSLLCFGMAHLVLFRLHLPGRYTQYGTMILMPIAAALVWGVGAEMLGHRAAGKWRWAARSLPVLLAAAVLLYPFSLGRFPNGQYLGGRAPAVYEFLAALPEDAVIAGMSDELDNVPTFARRSVLSAREYGIPYHWGYYAQFRDRVAATLEALYSPDLGAVAAFQERYGVDFWLLDAETFTLPYLRAEGSWMRENRWFAQFQPAFDRAIAHLQTPPGPTLANAIAAPCIVFQGSGFQVLDGSCLTQLAAAAPQGQPP
ncbi:MAG: hypothetical protein MH825_09735 [Cyanobacteria bacterium]|nr:hypothetical protein [Cyanobacteriota bacterium]